MTKFLKSMVVLNTQMNEMWVNLLHPWKLKRNYTNKRKFSDTSYSQNKISTLQSWYKSSMFSLMCVCGGGGGNFIKRKSDEPGLCFEAKAKHRFFT